MYKDMESVFQMNKAENIPNLGRDCQSRYRRHSEHHTEIRKEIPLTIL